MKFIRSLKFKILLIGLSLSIALSLFLSLLIYEDLKKAYMEKQIEYTAFNLQLIMNNIDKEYAQIMGFGSSLSNDTRISDFLTDYGKPNVNSDYLKILAYRSAQNRLLNIPLNHNIEICFVYSNDDEAHIQLGRQYGHYTDYDHRFSKDIKGSQVKQQGIVDSPYFYFPKEKIIPISMPVYSSIGSGQIGWVEIIINAKIISQYISDYVFDSGSKIFILIEGKSHEITNSHISDELKDMDNPLNYKVQKISDKVSLIDGGFDSSSDASVLVTSSNSGWMLIQTLPKFSLYDVGSSEYGIIFIVIGIIIFLATLAILGLFRIINRPISKISNRIEHIANGDFTYDPTIEGYDELGQIGKGINTMSRDLNKWIQKSLETQKLKKNYEFKMLQNQINPHFLYNTLNSIKWMGSIQRSTGIVEMTSALINMLRKVAKTDSGIITIEEELKFVSDYMTIQQYRYGNIFSVHYNVEDPKLYRAKIIKFSLQPIVENAIFYGIEPKNKPGNIEINVRTMDEIMQIQIRDNGVGMSPEKVRELNKLLDKTQDNTNGIGLYNIHQRIVMEYGDRYGLKIESEKGKYTSVTLEMPLIY